MMQSLKVEQKKQFGIFWIICAAILWSLQGVLGKLNTWNPIYLSGFRAIAAAVTIGTYRKNYKPLKSKTNWLAAMFVALTGILFLSANNLTTAANAIAIQYTMPMFVIVMSWIKWKKKPKTLDIVSSIIMLIGVVFCFSDGFTGGKMAGNTLAILSAVTYALVYLSAKFEGCDALSYSYQGCLLSIPIFIVALFDSSFQFSMMNVLTGIAMGIFVGAGYCCFAKGFTKGVNSTQAAVVSYIEPILNPILVLIFVGEKINKMSIVGISIVLIMAVIYSVFSNKQEQKEK